jgi:hypothetical protein
MDSGDSELRKRTLFRAVNARIRVLSERFGFENGTFEVLCECGDERCVQRIEVPRLDFVDLADDQHRFVVAPDHELPGRDRVVARSAAYRVVTAEPGTPLHSGLAAPVAVPGVP